MQTFVRPAGPPAHCLTTGRPNAFANLFNASFLVAANQLPLEAKKRRLDSGSGNSPKLNAKASASSPSPI